MTDQPKNQNPAPGAGATAARKSFSDWLIPVLLAILVAVVILKPILSPSVVHLDESAWRHDTQQAMAEAAADGTKPMLALFSADWCAGCQVLKKQVFVDGSVAEDLSDKVRPIYVDMTAPAFGSFEDTLAYRYQIQAYPTTLLLTPEGMELGRISGAVPPEKFAKWLEEHMPAGTLAHGLDLGL